MWLFNFFTKQCDDQAIQPSVQDNSANDDQRVDESPLNEEETRAIKLKELHGRVKHLNTLHEKLEVLKEQNRNSQITPVVQKREKNEEHVASNENENEKIDQIDKSEIEKIKTTIGNFENLQMLCEKVSHLTDTLADIQKDTMEEREKKEKETVSECNIKSNVINSVNTSNKSSSKTTTLYKSKLIENTKSTRTTDTSKGKNVLTKKNEKVTTKNKPTTFKANSTKSKISGVPTNENREENDKWKMLDCRLLKIENKMAANENNIENLMCRFKTIISHFPVDHTDVRDRSNNEIGNEQRNREQQVNPEDIKYTYDQNESKVVRKVQSKSLQTNEINENNDDTHTCTVNQCVCKLIGNDMNPNEDINKNRYGIQIICDYFQSKFCAKQSECPRSKTEQVDNKPAWFCISNDVKVNERVTVCSNKSNYILNNIKENRIEPTFKSNYGKNGICDFVHSQPNAGEKINLIPEQCRKTQEKFSNANRTISVVRKDKYVNIVKSPRQQIIEPKPEFSNLHQKNRKIYNINRVVDDNNQNEVKYKITLDEKR